ncbi:MAG: AMP-binding protein [Lachnospiraceae bacterium]|nr:AMP-binding protein [Lachnospiraceae bacterium]
MKFSNDHIVYDNAGYPEVHIEDASTLMDLVRSAGKTFGDKVFIRWDKDETIYEKSFAEFAADTEKIALWADETAKSYGHPIHAALLGRSGYNYLATLLGIAGAGSVSVPTDVQLSHEVLTNNMRHADIDIVFYDWEYESQASYIRENCPNVKQLICLQKIRRRLSIPVILETPTDGPKTINGAAPSDCAIIIFTSGTTGGSKGVMLSHINCIDNIYCNDDLGDQYNEIALNVLPINHVFCLNGDFFTLLRYGTTVAISSDLKKLFHDIKLFKPTYIRMVPMMLKAVNSHLQTEKQQHPEMSDMDIREKVLGAQLHKLISGGGYLSKELADDIASFGIEIGQGYGMSECSPKIAVPDYDRPEKRGSVGFLVRKLETRIEDGELLVKSPSVMMGYYKDEERTKEALTEDGFLRTGDLAYIDDENFLYLTGRKKNLIILSNGENVSPESIENLFDSDVLISDILIYAEGDRIAAEVYPNYEYAGTTGISDIEGAVKAILDRHNEELPTYSRISSLKVREHPFKKTSSRKIIRGEYFNEKKAEKDKAATIEKPQNKLQQTIYDLLLPITGNSLMGIHDNLYECGLDSMGCILLIEGIEEKLNKVISFNDLIDNNSIEKIASLVESASAEQAAYPPKDIYALTTMQMYFGYIIKGNTTGNLPFTFELDPAVDLKKLKKAIEDTINAHPGLKGIISPNEKHILELHRHDDWEPDIPIVKLSEEEWAAEKERMLVPFSYTADDKLYHISIYETEKAKYLLFDVAHIMGDGMTMNILLQDVNSCYAGKPIEKEVYSFYDYSIDEKKREEAGVRKANTRYYADLLDGYRMSRSVLNKKNPDENGEQVKGVIRKRFDKLTKLKVQYFCNKQSISENVLFVTAFNYCVGLFADENDVMTCSIHSGRTDGRWRRIAGPLFLTYYLRQQTIPHETTLNLLKRMGRQIIDTMRCQISVPREGEMFFQYQGDIIEIDEVGGLPAKRIHLQLDSLPFHLQVMSDSRGYYTELRYWKNRFDEDLLRLFLDCYEAVLLAMEKEPSARCLKKHIPDSAIPKHYKIKAGVLNSEAGTTILENVDPEEEVRVYVLNDRFTKKPYGAWGKLYVMDKKPVTYVDEIDNPYREGVLYDTGLTARIMLDGQIDFLEKSGRTVLTDGHNGRKYYSLGLLEQSLTDMPQINKTHAYLLYDRKINEMKLAMDVETSKDSFVDRLRNYAGENCGKDLVPAVVNIVSEE